MRVLLLCPYPSRLAPTLDRTGDSYIVRTSPLDHLQEATRDALQGTDFVVSYGYRHLIRRSVVETLGGKVINLHASLLPWNRGADPNFWSFFDDTPKGVSIHVVDAGLDTGPILVQRELHFGRHETLASTYDELQREIVRLFDEFWPPIRIRSITPREQGNAFTYHRSVDKDRWFAQLPMGWATPVRDVEELGRRARQSAQVTARRTSSK